jgi:hypothetical protein
MPGRSALDRKRADARALAREREHVGVPKRADAPVAERAHGGAEADLLATRAQQIVDKNMNSRTAVWPVHVLSRHRLEATICSLTKEDVGTRGLNHRLSHHAGEVFGPMCSLAFDRLGAARVRADAIPGAATGPPSREKSNPPTAATSWPRAACSGEPCSPRLSVPALDWGYST